MNVKKKTFHAIVVLLTITLFASAESPKTGAALQRGTFSVEVSGHHNLTWSGKAHAFKSPGGDWGIQLIKPQKGDTPVTSVLIMIPVGTKGGTHKLSAYEKVFDSSGKLTSIGATFSSPKIVCINAEGTLSLTSLEPDFSGSFQFSAHSGFDATQKFNVKGSFEKLQVQK